MALEIVMRRDPRQRQLEEIALGEVAPPEAFLLLRELLTDDAARFAKRVYLALHEVVWRLVADRATGDEVAEWVDVCGRVSSLMHQARLESYGHQVSTLTDLGKRTAQFFEAQPVQEVLGRRHVAEVLRLLSANAGRTSRAAVLEATSLGQSNLSRMIAMLEGHGLVRRDKSGRHKDLILTEAGMAAAARLDARATPLPFEALWQAYGIGICVRSHDGGLLSANPGFEDAVGTPAEVAAASLSFGLGPEDVGTAENRWVRRIEIGKVDGGTASVWVDVSDLYLSLAEADRRRVAAEARAAGLKEALATAQAQAAAAEKRLRRQQLSVEVVRDLTVGRLGSMAKLLHDRSSAKVKGSGRVGVKPYTQLVAVKDALHNLLESRVLTHPPYPHQTDNGMTIIKGMVESTNALTNSVIVVEYPDWLRAEKADFRALMEPLSQFLLIGYGAVEMTITRDERSVFVHGIRHPFRKPSGDVSNVIDPAAANAFADAWTGFGVDVHVSAASPQEEGVGFRMSVPRGEIRESYFAQD